MFSLTFFAILGSLVNCQTEFPTPTDRYLEFRVIMLMALASYIIMILRYYNICYPNYSPLCWFDDYHRRYSIFNHRHSTIKNVLEVRGGGGGGGPTQKSQYPP